MADSNVQLPIPVTSGKLVDASQITQDAGTVVQRQRVVVGDPNNQDSLATADQLLGLSVTIQADSQARVNGRLLLQALQMQINGMNGNGFVPIETPEFLTAS